MITESQIYWITRLDSVKGCVEGVGITGSVLISVGLIIALTIWLVDDDDQGKKAFKVLLSILLIFTLIAVGSIFIPSTKEYYAIKIIPMAASNDAVQELPGKMVELANEWIEELRPDDSNKEE